MKQNASNLQDFAQKERMLNNEDRRKHFYKGLLDTEFHHYYDHLYYKLKDAKQMEMNQNFDLCESLYNKKEKQSKCNKRLRKLCCKAKKVDEKEIK